MRVSHTSYFFFSARKVVKRGQRGLPNLNQQTFTMTRDAAASLAFHSDALLGAEWHPQERLLLCQLFHGGGRQRGHDPVRPSRLLQGLREAGIADRVQMRLHGEDAIDARDDDSLRRDLRPQGGPTLFHPQTFAPDPWWQKPV